MAPVLGIWASSFNSRTFQPTGSYDALATYTVPSGGVATVEFAGLPTGGQYQHLQIRALARDTYAASDYDACNMTFNSDTSSVYAKHYLYGNGSSAGAGGAGSQSNFYGPICNHSSSTASAFAGTVIDILDFASSAKFKTVRILGGVDLNGSGVEYFMSGLYQSTNPLNSIKLTAFGSSNFAQYSQFSLYGVKG